ncbi:MAG: hypothetical protein RR193_06290 [Christensenellaceae bacterium]
MAQVDFIYKKDSYTFKISLGQDDISGMYMDFSNTKEFSAGDTAYTISYNSEGKEGRSVLKISDRPYSITTS